MEFFNKHSRVVSFLMCLALVANTLGILSHAHAHECKEGIGISDSEHQVSCSICNLGSSPDIKVATITEALSVHLYPGSAVAVFSDPQVQREAYSLFSPRAPPAD